MKFYNKSFISNFDQLVFFGIGCSAVGLGISYSNFYLFHLVFFSIGILWLLKFKENNFLFSVEQKINRHLAFFIIIFFWYSLSIFWAPNFLLAVKYLFYILCGLLICFSVVKFSKSIEKFNLLFRMLSFIFIIELIISIFESFTSFRLPISPFSNWHTFFGKESVDFFSFEYPLAYSDFSPPTGFRWNTNNLAITMVLILPFFLCHNRTLIKIIGGISIFLVTIMSASRAVFLGIILIYFFYLLIIKKQIGTIIMVWTLIISLFWGMNTLTQSNIPRINEIANSLEALELYIKGDLDVGGSLKWRRELIDNGITDLISSNGLGVGAGGSTALQEIRGGVAGRFTSMHNFWIEVLVEGGIIIGLISLFWYASILINLFFISKKSSSKTIKYYAESLMLSMIGFIPSSIAASSTIYFFPMWILFGMSISVIYLNRNLNSIVINNH